VVSVVQFYYKLRSKPVCFTYYLNGIQKVKQVLLVAGLSIFIPTLLPAQNNKKTIAAAISIAATSEQATLVYGIKIQQQNLLMGRPVSLSTGTTGACNQSNGPYTLKEKTFFPAIKKGHPAPVLLCMVYSYREGCINMPVNLLS
jgi:hypothetical protein